jgi:chromosome segregation ATPase
MEMENELQTLKTKYKSLELDLSNMKEHALKLEQRLKEYEPHLESVGGTFTASQEKAFQVSLRSITFFMIILYLVFISSTATGGRNENIVG